MKTTVKKPNWIVRWWNDLICAPPPRDPAYHTNEEMLEIIERHHRLLLEAAKNAGLDIGDEYDAAQGRIMETTVKSPSEARVRLDRYLEARRRAKEEGRVQRASNKEMLEQLERHHRLLIEAAKKAGLPSAYDYDDF